MRNLVISAIFGLCLALPAAGQTGPDAAIQDTIRRQFDAFEAGDLPRAFDLASPMIRMIFVTPENFGTMVRQGYPMVLRPAEIRFLALRQEDGAMWQRVLVRGSDGAVHVLDYRMTEGPDGWRIDGVLKTIGRDFVA